MLKPDKLTGEEFKEIKKHTTYGADLIRQAEDSIDDPEVREFLSMGREIAHYHQEKWDAADIQRHCLAKTSPCLPALWLSQVFMMLSLAGVVIPPFPHDESIAIIAKGKGNHFDPIMTDAFLKISEQFSRSHKNLRIQMKISEKSNNKRNHLTVIKRPS